MNLTPITLTSSRIEYSDIFTKTLYIQFKSSRTLSSLSRIIQNAVSVKNNYKLNLHLSLLYAHIQKEEQQRVASEIKIPRKKLIFNQIKAIATQSHIRFNRDVCKWVELACVDLEG